MPVELDETEPDFLPVRTRCSCSVESVNSTTLHNDYEQFQFWKFVNRRFVTRRGSLRPLHRPFALGSRDEKEVVIQFGRPPVLLPRSVVLPPLKPARIPASPAVSSEPAPPLVRVKPPPLEEPPLPTSQIADVEPPTSQIAEVELKKEDGTDKAPTDQNAMSEMLNKIGKCALRHDEMLVLRNAAAADFAAVAATKHAAEAAEPGVETRSEFNEWLKWAKKRAEEHAHTAHPRKKRADGAVEKLKFLAPANDVLDAVGLVPTLYLDFLKFCAGYCLLGALLSVPSYAFSAARAHEVFSAVALDTYPTALLQLSIAARSECRDDGCKTMNTVAGLLEALFSVLLLLGVRRFRTRVKAINDVNEANNVFTSEYAIQLHGMPPDATKEEIKEHLETVVAAATGKSREECAVWDVALITDCASVLRNAVLQTPLEREYAINERKLRIEYAFRKEQPDGWPQTQVIGELKTLVESLSSRLLKTRTAITASTSITKVCGAFVTFEEQPARNAALQLYRGGWGYIAQPKARRFRSTTPSGCCDKGWRLRAFAPPHPGDVLHENLPYRLLRLDFKAFTTFCRRLIATALLVAFLLVSFGVIIGVNAAKMDPDALFSDLDPETKEIIVDSLFPLLASIILVVVNTSIAVMVSTLGEFERYPTLSGMHQNRAVTIFVAQAFNTGFVTLLLMAAPPPEFYRSYEPNCQCPKVFCCGIGSKGLIMRGPHLTMSWLWHLDVGTVLVSAMVVQTITSITWVPSGRGEGKAPWVPYLVFHCKKRFLANGKRHRADMEKLYSGPAFDLPTFLGKAYAHFFVVIAYAGVLPILYLTGAAFFIGSWLCERFGLFYLHTTPPPYSYELIEATLWWMPWTVLLHVGFTFWGFAELPTWRVRAGAWSRPFDNQTLWQAMDEPKRMNTDAGVLELPALNFWLTSIYDVPNHVNSLPTIALFVLFLLLLLVLVLICACATCCCCWPAGGVSCRRNKSRVMPNKSRVMPQTTSEDKADEGDGAHAVVDPPFSKILVGVTRENVRVLDGEVIHGFQRGIKDTRLTRLLRWTPTALMFRMLGMAERLDQPISDAEWETAEPLFSKLTRAADISYQPEFHPSYETAWTFLANPTKLQAFVAGEKLAEELEKAKARALAAQKAAEDGWKNRHTHEKNAEDSDD